MKGEKLELVRGSGNVFRELKALLAAEIIKALDREELTIRAAHARTGFAASDSRASATPTSQGSRLIGLCQFSTA